MKHRNTSNSFGLHPYQIIVYLFIAAITALFLSFSIAYIYTRVQFDVPPVKIPFIFLINTFILIGASLILHFARHFYRTDQANRYKHALLWAIILTLFFLIGQIYGWSWMLRKEMSFSLHPGTSHLYLISGVHFMHVLIGLPFIILFYTNALRKTGDAISALLYFSDPEKKLMLNLITVYWHFMDILWIYLVTFFAVNYLL